MDVIEEKPVVARRSNRGAASAIAIIVIALVVGVGGFVGGMQYQKSHGSSSSLASANQAAGQNGLSGQNGFGGRSINGSFGTVTAVSSSSISVKNDRDSTTKTYSISGSTTVTDDGTTKAVGDIAVGDTVMVRTDSSTSTAATSIRLNPTMGGPGQGMDGSSTSSDSSSSST